MKKRIQIDHLSTLCIGLDIGSRNNYITALDFDSNRLINMKPVPNAASGAEEMENMILAVLEANSQFKYLLIAMESTSFTSFLVANPASDQDPCIVTRRACTLPVCEYIITVVPLSNIEAACFLKKNFRAKRTPAHLCQCAGASILISVVN